MLKKLEFWLLSVLAAASLLLVVVNIGLVRSNQAVQASVNARAQYIQQSIQLQTLYQEIVKGLADLAVGNDDQQLRDVLSGVGITISTGPEAGAAPAGAAKQKP